MSTYQLLSDLNLSNKIVLIRADLNVPMREGRVSDNARIAAFLPTLKLLSEQGAKSVILSHLGRPKKKGDPALTLRPIAEELSALWKRPVPFVDDCIGDKVKDAISKLAPGDAIVLENTRYYPEEEANDPEFTKSLAALGDFYVNDAFSTAHRAHATTEGLAHHLPSAAGLLMQAEIEALSKALENPQRPLAAFVGGAKISTKTELLKNLITKVNVLALGGGMANTFLAAKGLSVGKSLCEPDMFDTSREIMSIAEQRGCHILLPRDAVVAKALEAGVATQVVSIAAIPHDQMILDIGPASINEIKDTLSMCKTVVWNGPFGAFETKPFDKATTDIAICVADLTKRGKLLSVAGGGDTASALAEAGVTNGMSYVSLAGGAFLEWMEGKELPGVAALRKDGQNVKVGKVIL